MSKSLAKCGTADSIIKCSMIKARAPFMAARCSVRSVCVCLPTIGTGWGTPVLTLAGADSASESQRSDARVRLPHCRDEKYQKSRTFLMLATPASFENLNRYRGQAISELTTGNMGFTGDGIKSGENKVTNSRPHPVRPVFPLVFFFMKPIVIASSNTAA